MQTESPYSDMLAALRKSAFRRRFRVRGRDAAYFKAKGFDEIMRHASKFIDERLASASPRNDGRQTPMRGHPVFVAQHATATCCRSCLAKWHGIAEGHALTEREKHYVLELIGLWLAGEHGAQTE